MRLSAYRQLFVLLLSFCLLQLLSGCARHSQGESDSYISNTVSNNLSKVGLILTGQIGDHHNFATSFSNLTLSPTNEELFVVPGNRRGNRGDVQRWTDYIYVGKAPADMVPGAALVISPPENHHGEYGYVLFADTRVVKLPAQTVRDLVAKPWLFATNTAPEVLDYYKKQIKIWIPDRLISVYPQ